MAQHYKEAAIIIDKIESRKGSVRSLVFHKRVKNKKLMMALVTQTIRHKPLIEKLLVRTDLVKEPAKLKNPGMFHVMAYDLLFGKKKLQGGGYAKRLMMECRCESGFENSHERTKFGY
eukprot:TRINITY_DN2961_c0_g1_i7.p2 TRINITY_DN2961_c0_g1~~TRINITY_DN2961_c0_g1_i7.p2  ORF type:complete len:128 (+),score=25.57 TRINITY_DN2961_c0_g1_i7:32-385(+)